jgi:hypothetical protein
VVDIEVREKKMEKIDLHLGFDQEEFDDTKRVIRIRISKKDRQHNEWPKEKSTKGQTTIYKTYT